MYAYLADDATAATAPTTATTTYANAAVAPVPNATDPAGQPPPPMRQPRWYPRSHEGRQWAGPRRQQLPRAGQQQAPQFYDAQMQAVAQQQQITAQQQAAPTQAQPQPQSSGWKDFLPQIAIGVGAALIVGVMTGKK